MRLVRSRRPERKTSPILPPLRLYREILRAHAHKLPGELRPLGDQYVKTEFKAHKNSDNPLHIVGFLAQWQDYLKNIDGGEWISDTLSKENIDKMSPEQVGQLYELMEEAKKVGAGE